MKSIARLTGRLSALTVAAAISSTSVQADVTLDFEQQGSDVVASYSGAWTSWTTTGQLNLNNISVNANGFQSLGAAEERFWSGALTTKATGADWTTLDIDADSFTGDAFGFSAQSPGFLYAAVDYTAGTPFSGSLTFNNTSIVDLGLTPGDVGSFTSSGGTINYTVSAVPEPATVSMLAAGCVAAGLGFVRRRRKGSQSVALRGYRGAAGERANACRLEWPECFLRESSGRASVTSLVSVLGESPKGGRCFDMANRPREHATASGRCLWQSPPKPLAGIANCRVSLVPFDDEAGGSLLHTGESRVWQLSAVSEAGALCSYPRRGSEAVKGARHADRIRRSTATCISSPASPTAVSCRLQSRQSVSHHRCSSQPARSTRPIW